MASPLGNGVAVLAMDLQWDFLQPSGRWPIDPTQARQVVAGMNTAILRAARSAVPVIYVVNAFDLFDPSNLTRNFCALRGSDGARIDPRISVVEGAPKIAKRTPSAFDNPALASLLSREQIGRLVVGGVYAEACVTATCRAALAHGYAVCVLEDAVGARSDNARRRALENLRRRGARSAGCDGREWM